jgi:hypothetical protein
MKDKRLRNLEFDRVATLRDSERANRFSNTPSNSFGKSQSRVDVATAHVFAHSPNDLKKFGGSRLSTRSEHGSIGN